MRSWMNLIESASEGFPSYSHFPYSLYKKISLTIAATHPPKKIIHLCIIIWILVQSYTVNDLILFGGHCDLYIMVQRFCFYISDNI